MIGRATLPSVVCSRPFAWACFLYVQLGIPGPSRGGGVSLGAWGTAVFSDDLAADIREDWRDYVGEGMTPEAATRQILADHGDATSDPEESGVVWLALAVSQWRTGRIVPDVLARAIEIIDSGSDLRRWEQQPKLRQARARVLERTREQLLSQPPEPRRIPRPRRSETPFGPGDVLLYRHRSGREFVFWVTGNWSDKGGEYNTIEVLDLGGMAPPPLTELHRLPGVQFGGRLPDTPLLTRRIGLTLIDGRKVPGDRLSLLGNASYPPGRPRLDAWGASARDLDDVLDQLLSEDT